MVRVELRDGAIVEGRVIERNAQLWLFAQATLTPPRAKQGQTVALLQIKASDIVISPEKKKPSRPAKELASWSQAPPLQTKTFNLRVPVTERRFWQERRLTFDPAPMAGASLADYLAAASNHSLVFLLREERSWQSRALIQAMLLLRRRWRRSVAVYKPGGGGVPPIAGVGLRVLSDLDELLANSSDQAMVVDGWLADGSSAAHAKGGQTAKLEQWLSCQRRVLAVERSLVPGQVVFCWDVVKADVLEAPRLVVGFAGLINEEDQQDLDWTESLWHEISKL